MKIVHSSDNPRFKAVKRLSSSSQVRRREGKALLEGAHLCHAWLAAGFVPLECYVGQSGIAEPEIAAILSRLDSTMVTSLSDALLASISLLETGASILFLIEPPDPGVPETLVTDSILIDRIQDPGNLGSILRSAAAAGVAQVYCASGTVAAWSQKVLRAAMGAHFSLKIFEQVDLNALVTGATIPVFATSSHASATLYGTRFSGPCGWVFGNEGEGVAASLLDAVTVLRIPQPGGQESLNVAAAAAICLFEASRQRTSAVSDRA